MVLRLNLHLQGVVLTGLSRDLLMALDDFVLGPVEPLRELHVGLLEVGQKLRVALGVTRFAHGRLLGLFEAVVFVMVFFGSPAVGAPAVQRLGGVLVRVCAVFIVLELVVVQQLRNPETGLRLQQGSEWVLLQAGIVDGAGGGAPVVPGHF